MLREIKRRMRGMILRRRERGEVSEELRERLRAEGIERMHRHVAEMQASGQPHGWTAYRRD